MIKEGLQSFVLRFWYVCLDIVKKNHEHTVKSNKSELESQKTNQMFHGLGYLYQILGGTDCETLGICF